jgi:predicted S18 family serine protease
MHQPRDITGYVFVGGFFLFAMVLTLFLLSQSPKGIPADTGYSEVKSAVIDSDPSTPIPASSDAAKELIKTASVQAAQGDYPAAISTMQTAVQQFPTDLNLQLTLEYYETEAVRHQP